MVTANHKPELEKNLAVAMGLDRIFESDDFKLYLLPAIEKLSQVQLLDPKNFKTREEFARAADLAFEKAITYRDLVKFLSSQKQTIEKIRKQMEAPTKNWGQ